PLILFNIWDAGSANAVASAGAKAIATGSAPVAMAHGFGDGENIPLELVLDNLKRIIATVDLPVTTDIEGGYGAAPEVVADTVTRSLNAGAIGFNFEDQIVGTAELYDLPTQIPRIEAARKAADAACDSIFINARTDSFLKASPDTHTPKMLEDAITRAKSFADAGADGFFAPGLADEGMIARLCEESPLPVNIIALPHVPDTKTLTGLGVARISYGPVPYKRMIAWLEGEALKAMGDA
ncbi:MAG: isocitrate lyase/phosphoenolpyruvate mutase family protein, partial [Gammaproteobacteria bacterium]|nr:isocitrate lyase/phosphoenolpyruvate mutase family protein [Gammaproteobacteria bacterium]